MASNEISQTHKEFKTRKKRIKIKHSYDEKENAKLNEIEDIDEQISILQKQREEKVKEYNDISTQKLKNLSILYNDSDLIKNIVSYAKCTTYSKSTLEDIEKNCSLGINEDNIDLDIIEKISLAEERINVEIKHTNVLGDILNDFGNSVKFPGEEDDYNGN